MEFLRLLATMLQTCVQCFYFLYYFNMPHKKKAFFLIFAFFMLILFPLDFIVPVDLVLLKNIGNLFLLGFFFYFVFHIHEIKAIILGVLTYWFALVAGELILISLLYLFFGQTVDINTYSYMSFFLQLLAVPVLGTIYLIALKFLKKVKSNEYKMFIYLIVLLLNSILTAFCICFLLVPVESNQYFFEQNYQIILILLALLSVGTLFSLWKYAQKEMKRRSIQQIEEAYKKELQKTVYEKNDLQSMKRFRHDLLNYLEQLSIKQES